MRIATLVVKHGNFFSDVRFYFFGFVFSFRMATLVVIMAGPECFVPHMWHLSFSKVLGERRVLGEPHG